MKGIRKVVADVITEMEKNGETIPESMVLRHDIYRGLESGESTSLDAGDIKTKAKTHRTN